MRIPPHGIDAAQGAQMRRSGNSRGGLRRREGRLYRLFYPPSYVGSVAIRFYLPMDVLLANDNVAQLVVVAKDLEAREALRAELEQALRAELPDVGARATPLDLSAGEAEKSVRITVRQSEARALGLSSADVSSILATTFAGAPITAIRDGERLVQVVAHAQTRERSDLQTLASLQIPTPSGAHVALSQLADLAYTMEQPIIWRRQRLPQISVQADVADDEQPASVAARLAPTLARFRAALPPGYTVEQGGAVEEAEKGNASVFRGPARRDRPGRHDHPQRRDSDRRGGRPRRARHAGDGGRDRSGPPPRAPHRAHGLRRDPRHGAHRAPSVLGADGLCGDRRPGRRHGPHAHPAASLLLCLLRWETRAAEAAASRPSIHAAPETAQ
jgi:hypothetical protein